jgi:hypothetical protein
MRNGENGLADRERLLIKLYMELTSAKESAARGVFMYVCERDGAGGPPEEKGNDIFGRQEGYVRAFELDFGSEAAQQSLGSFCRWEEVFEL